MEVVDFANIETPLPDLDEVVWKDLSCDQQLLYRWTKAVASGSVPRTLANQVAGSINHSRWLTLAVRLLQLYTKTTNPSEALKKIVKFIVQVYSPSWFKIKSESKFTSGPSNLFYQMKLVQNQPEEAQNVVKPVIQRNGYFAEPGVLLCSMLESDNKDVKSKAIDILKSVRSKPPKPPQAKALKGIRKFKIPDLKWEAENWWEIIDWGKIQVHEPKILSNISTQELEEAYAKPMNFPNFPCHSQSVEQAVKLVTEASSQVCGEEKRHNHIVSVIASRKVRQPFNSKKDYNYSMDED